jgi:hypothetical protein
VELDVMGTKTVSILISSLTLGLCIVNAPSAVAVTAITSSTAITSTQNNNTSAESTIIGSNGVIMVNGDTVKVQDGKVTVNGIAYGTIDKQSVVKYSVKGSVKKLFVDGVERGPSP